jgi:hypothetical protein
MEAAPPGACRWRELRQMPVRTTGFRIARILGIPIYLDASWLLIFGLITYSLAMAFRELHPQWTSAEHWT